MQNEHSLSPIELSIIIPTRRNLPHLSRCVSELIPSLEGIAAEIIIVINDSEAEANITSGYVEGLKGCYSLPLYHLQVGTPGFVPAVNEGLKRSTGRFICVLNDDTIPARNWFTEVRNAKETAELQFPEITWGYFGPVSNCAINQQVLDRKQIPSAYDPEAVETTARILQSAISFIPAATLSGFCLIFLRELYEEIGGFHQFGFGGWDDNDFCLRAQEAGYAGLIAHRSFVHHIGHVTLQKVAPHNPVGLFDIASFLRKWYQPRKKTVCAAYCVKIDNHDDWLLFRQSLTRMRELSDFCVIVDDGSSLDWIPTVVNEFPGWIRTIQRNSQNLHRNESRDRNSVLQLARQTNADWIWSLDHDEQPDKRLTNDQLQRLLNPINPQILCYQMPVATFWRGKEKIRTDGIWGHISHTGLFRNMPAWGDIHPIGESKFHSRRTPSALPRETVGITFVCSIEHFGYWSYEKAIEKQNFYNQQDTVKDSFLIGNVNYNHICDESHLHLLAWSTPTVSLAYLHKNELQDLCQRLMQYGQMFNEVVVVDTGSTESIKDLCLHFGLVYQEFRFDGWQNPELMLPDFASARNYAISLCSMDYIFFLDPDEEIERQGLLSFDKVLLQQADSFLIHINNLHRNQEGLIFSSQTEQPRLFRRDQRIFYTDRVHETLETALKKSPELLNVDSPLTLRHYGFLKTTPEERIVKNGKYGELLRRVVEEDPTNARAWFALGVHLRDRHQPEDAFLAIEKALELQPRMWNAIWELALMHCRSAAALLLDISREDRPKIADELLQDLSRWLE